MASRDPDSPYSREELAAERGGPVANRSPEAVNLGRMKKIITLISALALLAAACADGGISRSTAAVVDGETITVKQVQNGLDRFVSSAQFEQLTQEQEPESIKRQFEQSLLSRLIRRSVLRKEAVAAGVEVSDEDVAERIDQFRQDFENEDAFLEEIERQGTTLKEVEEFVHDSLLEERLRAQLTEGTAPSEEEMRAFYDERSDQFAEIHTAHILVERKKLAERLKNQLDATAEKKLDDTFADLATEHSIDTGSGSQGGDLGFVNPSSLVPEYSQAVAAMEPGEISDPVQSQFGFHIIKLVDRRVAPFEDVRGQIEQQLTGNVAEEEWQKFIRKAYRDAGIEVNSRFGELDIESQLIVNASAESVPGGEPGEETEAPQPEEAPEEPADSVD
jgi:parvulin-like peptidyl-prolyl isomerase